MALFPNGFMPALRNNSDTLLQTGIGLIGGRTANEQAAMGLQGFAQGRKQNQTINFLRKNSPELAAAVESGALSGGDAYKLFYQKKLEAEKPANLSFQTLPDGTYGFANPQEGTFNALGTAQKPGGNNEYGLNPQTAVDAEGNPVLIQLGKGGIATQAQLPEGLTLSKEPIKLDAGTHFILLDPITRQPVGQIPKDLAGAERAKVGGKALGEADASLSSMSSKMPGLEAVVNRLDDLSKKATYTLAGQGLDAGMKQLGMEPRESAIARAEYIATVDNQVLPLLRDTFGAAFTQKEGETLRQTLGDPNKSPSEKQQVLKAFIQQKRRDVEALSAQTGQAPAGGGAQPGRTSTGVQWKVK